MARGEGPLPVQLYAEGSAFVSSISDDTVLGSKHMRKTLTAENHHLLRRPGVGLTGSEVLQLLDNIDLAGLAAVLADEDLIRLSRPSTLRFGEAFKFEGRPNS